MNNPALLDNAKFYIFENSQMLMTFQNIFDLNLEFPSETADLLDFPLHCLYKHKRDIKQVIGFGWKF